MIKQNQKLKLENSSIKIENTNLKNEIKEIQKTVSCLNVHIARKLEKSFVFFILIIESKN